MLAPAIRVSCLSAIVVRRSLPIPCLLPSFLPSFQGALPSASVRAARSFFPVGRLRRRYWENGSVQLAVTLVSFAAAVVVRAVVIQGAVVIQFKEEGRLKRRGNIANITAAAEFSWSTMNQI